MSSAQSTEAQTAASSAGKQEGGGGVLPVQLTKSLDSRKLKQGDEIDVKTAVELRTGDGTVIPQGSKVIGHVTQAKARANGDAESSLGLEFDRLTLKDGKEIPVKATIQAVGPEPSDAAVTPETTGAVPTSNPNTNRPSNTGMGTTAANSPPVTPGTSGEYDGGVNGGVSGSSQPARSPQLTPQSAGVIGHHDLQLGQSSILTSDGKAVKLNDGIELLLRVQRQ
jgi:hypothetical protein